MSLLLSMDGALWEIIGVSFRVSLMAMLIAVPPALLIAFVLVRCAFPGRWGACGAGGRVFKGNLEVARDRWAQRCGRRRFGLAAVRH